MFAFAKVDGGADDSSDARRSAGQPLERGGQGLLRVPVVRTDLVETPGLEGLAWIGGSPFARLTTGEIAAGGATAPVAPQRSST